jgi:hypothetical protein
LKTTKKRVPQKVSQKKAAAAKPPANLVPAIDLLMTAAQLLDQPDSDFGGVVIGRPGLGDFMRVALGEQFTVTAFGRAGRFEAFSIKSVSIPEA